MSQCSEDHEAVRDSLRTKILNDTGWWLNLYDTGEVDLLGARNLIAQIRKDLSASPAPSVGELEWRDAGRNP